MTLLDIPDLVTFWNYAFFPARIFWSVPTHGPTSTSKTQEKITLEGNYTLEYYVATRQGLSNAKQYQANRDH